jgi:hypothetical protein
LARDLLRNAGGISLHVVARSAAKNLGTSSPPRRSSWCVGEKPASIAGVFLRIAAVLLALPFVAPASAETKVVPQVVVRDDAVTAKLDGVPLPVVLASVADATGAEITGEVANPRDITLELRQVSLDEALKRLLGAQSFILTYGNDGRLKRIALGGASEVPTPRPDANGQQKPKVLDEAKEAVQRVAGVLQSDQAIAIRGRLAEFLGTDAAPFRDIAQAARKSEDQRVRAQARRAMVTALTTDPETREAFVTAVGSLSDEALVGAMRGAAGVDAPELAMAFVRHGGSIELTRSMQRALDQMRLQPAGKPVGN